MRYRSLIALSLVAGAALLLGGVLRERAGRAQSPAAQPSAVAQLQREYAVGNTAATIDSLQQKLRRTPGDTRSAALLGLAYEQRARETGDPTNYTNADGILHRALAAAPGDLLATAGLGSLALSRHRFRQALELGQQARRLSPTTAGVYGVIGDASLELGRYSQAFRAFDTMSRLKPNIASYARVSYARELLGDVSGAVSAMQLAADAAAGVPEASAWTSVQLGNLYFARGRLVPAERQFRGALAAFPGYYGALDGLAQIAGARGSYRQGIAYERQAVDRIPLPQLVGYLGDLYRAGGEPKQAQRQYRLIGVIQRLFVANGVRNDLDIALFDVDHGVNLVQALRLARLGHVQRPSIVGDDVLSWALARNGRCAEALTYSQRALRLGTRDALKFFHRGMIERCLGRGAVARMWFHRALAVNPYFSLLWSPLARRYAR